MHIADVHCTRHSTSSTATIMIKMGLQSTSIQVMMVMMVVVVVLYHWYSSDGMELVQCVPLVQKRRWGKTPNFLFSFASILLQQPIGHPSQSLQPSPSLHTISPPISISTSSTSSPSPLPQWRNKTSLVSGHLKISKSCQQNVPLCKCQQR